MNAVGVDVAPFSAMSDEAEVLLLPGLPLVNRTGENPESDLWTFEVQTPDASVSSDGGPPAVMIDYVHPGMTNSVNKYSLCYCVVWFMHCLLS